MPISKKDVTDYQVWKKAVQEKKLFIYNDPLIFEAKKKRDLAVSQGATVDIDPFKYQYDLEVHLFLFYDDFNTGLPREEHFWRAAELRWPTKIGPDGRPQGAFMRNPWNEQVAWAMCHYNLIKLMGGSGQGKTRTPLAAMCMVWDHFIETPSGSRMCFSSVNQDKLERAAWSNLTDLYRATSPGISKYAGRGDVRSGMKIKRPNMKGRTQDGYSRDFNKDGKGIMEAVLIGGSDHQAQARIDKMTGAHVPTALCFLLDEYQSMPVSPTDACFNLSTHPRFFWVFQAGNPNSYDDPLGNESEPKGGWDTVGPQDKSWESTDQYGRTGIVLHFNNEHSPGYEDPQKYWYMPTEEKCQRAYPTASSRDSVQYFRMWKGWFPPETMADVVLNKKLMRMSGATQLPNINPLSRIETAASFDSAPESHDRSQVTIFHKAVEAETNRQILAFSKTISVPKTYAETYYRDTAKWLAELFRKEGVPSGNIILDNTGSHGFGEELMRLGFLSTGVKYQSGASKELIDVNTEKYANEECHNLIAECALLTERFVTCGQIRGLSPEMLDYEKELCLRRWAENSASGKKQLESKKDFRARNGWSPDVFDTILQACYFARHEWGMIPGAHEHQQLASTDENAFTGFNDIYDNPLASSF